MKCFNLRGPICPFDVANCQLKVQYNQKHHLVLEMCAGI